MHFSPTCMNTWIPMLAWPTFHWQESSDSKPLHCPHALLSQLSSFSLCSCIIRFVMSPIASVILEAYNWKTEDTLVLQANLAKVTVRHKEFPKPFYKPVHQPGSRQSFSLLEPFSNINVGKPACKTWPCLYHLPQHGYSISLPLTYLTPDRDL
jgi:hypothetical protein